MVKLYPFSLSGVPKTTIWGGRLLSASWGKMAEADDAPLGESWELSVRKQENVRIQNGPYAGKTLGEILRLPGGKSMVSPNWDGVNFPLLIKLLDAGRDLSVQVHPDDAFARVWEQDVGKTEMWVILSAEPGARLVWGLLPGVGRDDLRRAVKEGRTESVLRHIPVRAGEVYFVPAGLVHAIGGGILLAEIQQNSDLTYRLYDYGRRDSSGQLRPLHTEKGCAAARAYRNEEIARLRFSRGRAILGENEQLLAHCDYFKVIRARSLPGKHYTGTVLLQSFFHLLFTDGAGVLKAGAYELSVKKGDSVFLPAGMGSYRIEGGAEWLCTSLPDR